MTRRAALSEGRGHTGDRQLDELWERINTVIRFLSTCPIADGRLLAEEVGEVAGSGLSFTAATPRSVAHGLGRRARGFFEVSGSDLASANHVGLYASAHPAGVTSATHITVTPGATGTCFVWVF